ncbi:MAG TPA: tetratricopeptide repeat protein [Terriglobia bacterium]|nr:tetratricopeptide repeat protein [Terriglobia bacterium]
MRNCCGLLGRILFPLALLAGTPGGQQQTAPPAAQAPAPEVQLQQAAAALEKEDYATASTILESYVAGHPDDVRARFNLALAYSMTGRQGDALRLYEALVSQQPELIPARMNLGILLLEKGSFAEALAQFDQVLAQQPDHWAAQVNRAGALVALGRTAEATQSYQQALVLKLDAPTLLEYGKLLAKTNPEAAEPPLRRALALDPALEEAKLVLASVLEDRAAKGAGTSAEAVSLYQELLAAHADRVDLRIRLAGIHLREKRLPEAIRELEAARAAAAGDAQLNRMLLNAYLQAKENDKAEALLPEMLALAPADAELRMLQGSLRMERRQFAQAAESFRSAIQLAPEAAAGYTNLASALYLLKDYAGTVAALEKVAVLRQDTAGTYFLRALALDQLGLKEAAYDNYQKFLAVDAQKNPDQEFQARQRSRTLARELQRRR